MTTIAITIDDETLELIDRLPGMSRRFRSRSALIRAAIRAYVRESERQAVRSNKRLLDRQLRALVKERANP